MDLVKYLRNPLTLDQPDHVIQVSVYEYEIPVSDSIVFDSVPEVQTSPVYIEYYGLPGKCTVSESFDEFGDLRSRYVFQYENDSMVEMRGDTAYENAIRWIKDHYMADGWVERLTCYSTDDTSKMGWRLDELGRTVFEFDLRRNSLDTGLHISYFYNNNDQVVTREFRSGDKKGRQSFSVYDTLGREIVRMSYDGNGKLLRESNTTYLNANESEIEQINYERNDTLRHHIVNFKDPHGNIIKEYFNSGYHPEYWKVTSYLIEYSTD